MTASTTMTEQAAAPEGSGTKKTRPAGVVSPRVQERLEREGRARRALFVAAVAGLAAASGIVAVSAGVPQAAAITQPARATESLGQRVVAEVPIQAAGSDNVTTIVRFVTADQDAPSPNVRTRATR